MSSYNHTQASNMSYAKGQTFSSIACLKKPIKYHYTFYSCEGILHVQSNHLTYTL